MSEMLSVGFIAGMGVAIIGRLVLDAWSEESRRKEERLEAVETGLRELYCDFRHHKYAHDNFETKKK